MNVVVEILARQLRIIARSEVKINGILKEGFAAGVTEKEARVLARRLLTAAEDREQARELKNVINVALSQHECGIRDEVEE